jgi:hypothetical protein
MLEETVQKQRFTLSNVKVPHILAVENLEVFHTIKNQKPIGVHVVHAPEVVNYIEHSTKRPGKFFVHNISNKYTRLAADALLNFIVPLASSLPGETWPVADTKLSRDDFKHFNDLRIPAGLRSIKIDEKFNGVLIDRRRAARVLSEAYIRSLESVDDKLASLTNELDESESSFPQETLSAQSYESANVLERREVFNEISPRQAAEKEFLGREAIQNAYSSSPDLLNNKIQVGINHIDKTAYVEDFGNGMDDYVLRNVFFKLGSSENENREYAAGKFGLGASLFFTAGHDRVVVDTKPVNSPAQKAVVSKDIERDPVYYPSSRSRPGTKVSWNFPEDTKFDLERLEEIVRKDCAYIRTPIELTVTDENNPGGATEKINKNILTGTNGTRVEFTEDQIEGFVEKTTGPGQIELLSYDIVVQRIPTEGYNAVVTSKNLDTVFTRDVILKDPELERVLLLVEKNKNKLLKKDKADGMQLLSDYKAFLDKNLFSENQQTIDNFLLDSIDESRIDTSDVIPRINRTYNLLGKSIKAIQYVASTPIHFLMSGFKDRGDLIKRSFKNLGKGIVTTNATEDSQSNLLRYSVFNSEKKEQVMSSPSTLSRYATGRWAQLWWIANGLTHIAENYSLLPDGAHDFFAPTLLLPISNAVAETIGMSYFNKSISNKFKKLYDKSHLFADETFSKIKNSLVKTASIAAVSTALLGVSVYGLNSLGNAIQKHAPSKGFTIASNEQVAKANADGAQNWMQSLFLNFKSIFLPTVEGYDRIATYDYLDGDYDWRKRKNVDSEDAPRMHVYPSPIEETPAFLDELYDSDMSKKEVMNVVAHYISKEFSYGAISRDEVNEYGSAIEASLAKKKVVCNGGATLGAVLLDEINERDSVRRAVGTYNGVPHAWLEYMTPQGNWEIADMTPVNRDPEYAEAVRVHQESKKSSQKMGLAFLLGLGAVSFGAGIYGLLKDRNSVLKPTNETLDRVLLNEATDVQAMLPNTSVYYGSFSDAKSPFVLKNDAIVLNPYNQTENVAYIAGMKFAEKKHDDSALLKIGDAYSSIVARGEIQ